eukprot:s3336_g4.t1
MIIPAQCSASLACNSLVAQVGDESHMATDKRRAGENAGDVAMDRTGVERLSYVQGDAASQVETLPSADVVIVDPPRKGLEDVVLNTLMRSKRRPQRLIYVSCGFPAFRRDAERLMDAKWRVTHAEGFVLFPGADRGRVWEVDGSNVLSNVAIGIL